MKPKGEMRNGKLVFFLADEAGNQVGPEYESWDEIWAVVQAPYASSARSRKNPEVWDSIHANEITKADIKMAGQLLNNTYRVVEHAVVTVLPSADWWSDQVREALVRGPDNPDLEAALTMVKRVAYGRIHKKKRGRKNPSGGRTRKRSRR